MPNSFRYLLAVTGLIALLFAAISAWPLFCNWLRLHTSPPVVPPPIAAQPNMPLSTSAAPQPGRSPAIHTQIKPLPPPATNAVAASVPPNANNLRPIASSGYVPGRWTTGDGEDALGTCVANESITLYNQPDGDPLVPATLNHCPLQVGKGTRLGMIRREGSWYLVHSTFATTGWVHEAHVTELPELP